MKNYNVNELRFERIVNGQKVMLPLTEIKPYRACKCLNCDAVLNADNAHAVFVPSKGVRFVCSEHYGSNTINSYHTNANNGFNTQGVKNSPLGNQSIGIEFEIYGGCDDIASIRSVIQSFFECESERDCTVSIEIPTSIQKGLGRISKVLQSIEMHSALQYFDNANCGAHVHTECNDVAYIRRYYHSIFCELSDYISNMPLEKRIEYFGRDFSRWAQKIDAHSEPTEHANFINTQHAHTLEFRLARIHGYKQYLNVVKFWRECGLLINTFDFNKTATDNNIRKMSAKHCGRELTAIARKYFPY